MTLQSIAQQSGTFKDKRDGKEYKTVKIGKQTWFAENLLYRSTEGEYWAYEDEDKMETASGFLYNWSAAINACPKGWHLPNADEWTTLFNFLGGNDVAGGKLKEEDTWDKLNVDATNSSGFTAIPGGYYLNSLLRYENYFTNAIFWSASATDNDNATVVFLTNESGKVSVFNNDKKDGYSIRCIKD